jgi:hypothetical protein
MRWAKHVGCMRKMRTRTKLQWRNLKGRYHMGDLGIDVRVISNLFEINRV